MATGDAIKEYVLVSQVGLAQTVALKSAPTSAPPTECAEEAKCVNVMLDGVELIVISACVCLTARPTESVMKVYVFVRRDGMVLGVRRKPVQVTATTTECAKMAHAPALLDGRVMTALLVTTRRQCTVRFTVPMTARTSVLMITKRTG